MIPRSYPHVGCDLRDLAIENRTFGCICAGEGEARLAFLNRMDSLSDIFCRSLMEHSVLLN